MHVYVYKYKYKYIYIYIIVNNINNEHLEILLTIPFQGCLDLRQVAHAIMPMCHDSAFATFILKRRVRRVDPEGNPRTK